MKKVYTAPKFEKIMIVSEDAVCSIFGNLFDVIIDSPNMIVSPDSIFEWETLENNGQ